MVMDQANQQALVIAMSNWSHKSMEDACQTCVSKGSEDSNHLGPRSCLGLVSQIRQRTSEKSIRRVVFEQSLTSLSDIVCR